ncbi:bifunctional 2-polyprenyl-6-hydroxyphenol methylase/3-demethylubiquinol 3-O-methyltransferase UbiG [Pseudarthrobacter sp. C4D7]|uniref:class I SAM-dependent methyltransferase n=1 Tax=Pseudarthrobacter sp. C4D7 TaxID=2735268 RepID=UPI001584B2A1|nr:class I SAM-dependent methyltransferase [Pseudarthrobacter sp. C4D7]NUT72761.1 class I SAM-dependent methyltransferase [Pseudarthrobacter sp. C4D7]
MGEELAAPSLSTDDYLSINQRTYEALADQYYERSSQDFHNDIPIVDRIWSLLETVVERRPLEILDVGCGHGVNLKMFSDLGAITTGFDFSPAMLSVAHTISPSSLLVQGDFMAHDWDAKYDLVFAKAFLHLFPFHDCPKIIQSMKSIVRDDGLIYLATTLAATSDEGYIVKHDYRGNLSRFRRNWTQGELKQFLLEQGLVIRGEWINDEPLREKTWQHVIVSAW